MSDPITREIDARCHVIFGQQVGLLRESLKREILAELQSKKPAERWLTVGEIADRISRSRASVHRYISTGKLKATNATGRLLVAESELCRFMEGGAE